MEKEADSSTSGNSDGEEDGEEDFKAVDFKLFIDRVKDRVKLEHIVIVLLIIVILYAIYDRQMLVDSCNNYWIAELEKIRNPVSIFK